MKKIESLALLSLFTFLMCQPVFADIDPMIQMKDFMQIVSKQMTEMQKTIEQQNQLIQKQNEKILELDTRARLEITPSSDVERTFEENLAAKIGNSDQWLKDLKFFGDGRLRYEGFDYTNGTASETDSRNRFRYRLRVGAEKKFSDQFKAGFSLASGEASNGQNVDPTATNTTFDNNFNFKDVFIDRAYAIYNPNWAKVGPIEKAEIGGGKFSNPFEKGSSDMIWDGDVKPEGAYEKVDLRFYDSEDLKVKAYGLAGQFILDEDASASNHSDAELFAWQAGLDTKFMTPVFEKPVGWFSAVSYYTYPDYAQNSNFLIGSTSLARGNSNFTGASTELDNDFKVIEFYNDVSFYPFPWQNVALKPFLDIAHNAADDVTVQQDETWAWALGAKLGGIKEKGDWEFGYAYKRIEANSVVGAFNDSDFGSGNSNKRGSVFKLAYALTDNVQLNGAAFFVNNLATGTGGVLDEETRRFQADLVYKFG